jgi:hypothetical protein
MKHGFKASGDKLFRTGALIALVTLLALSSGCVYALRTGSQPTEVKLRLVTPQPQRHSIRIGSDNPIERAVPENGKVAFTVPPLYGACDVYLCGFIKTSDGSPEKISVIELRRSGKMIRKLSLAQISKLPMDQDGYKLLKVRE